MNYIRSFLMNHFPYSFTERTWKEKNLGASNKILDHCQKHLPSNIKIQQVYSFLPRSNRNSGNTPSLDDLDIGIVASLPIMNKDQTLLLVKKKKDHSLLPTIDIPQLHVWQSVAYLVFI